MQGMCLYMHALRISEVLEFCRMYWSSVGCWKATVDVVYVVLTLPYLES